MQLGCTDGALAQNSGGVQRGAAPEPALSTRLGPRCNASSSVRGFLSPPRGLVVQSLLMLQPSGWGRVYYPSARTRLTRARKLLPRPPEAAGFMQTAVPPSPTRHATRTLHILTRPTCSCETLERSTA